MGKSRSSRASREPARAQSLDPATPVSVPLLWSITVGAALLVVYLLLTPGVSGDKDASEFTLMLAVGGVIHPTGYPIYTMLGHLYALLVHAAGATWAFAANSWAGLGGAVAIVLYHRLACGFLPASAGASRAVRFTLALLPTVLLGMNPIWTIETTMVEVYSWHMAWVCGACGYFLHLVRKYSDPERRVGARELTREMAAWGFLCGLGGAHHTTAIFFAASLTIGLIFVLSRAGRFQARFFPIWIGAGLVPLASYAYVYFRALHPVANQWPMLEPTLRSVVAHVRAEIYYGFLGRFDPSAVQRQLLQEAMAPYLVPALVLLVVACFRGSSFVERVVRFSFLAGAGAQLLFNLQYGVPDPAAYFLPVLAMALLGLLSLLRALAARRDLAVVSTVVIVALLGAQVFFWGRAAQRRERQFQEYDDLVRAMWKSIPIDKGIVIWPDDMYFKLKEYQVYFGEKPGLDVIQTAILPNDHARRVFTQKYGFDPLRDATREALRAPIHQDYVIGTQPPLLAHFFAVIHETIVKNASVPIVAFDPEKKSVQLFSRDPLPPG